MLIYKATNKINGKAYIGQTKSSLKKRRYNHYYKAFSSNSPYYFHNALRKYGKHSFEWIVICECDTKEELDEWEKYFIIYYNTLCGSSNNGYNLRYGGQSPHVSSITRKKISDSHKGMKKPWVSENLKKNNNYPVRKGKEHGMYGKTHTEDTRKKIIERNQKTYKVILPNKKYVIVVNLKKYCEENGLNVKYMYRVASGTQMLHKGHKCERL